MLGKPLPANLRILPDCVPASILIFTFPPTVLISFVVPKAASGKEMYNSWCRLSPSRFIDWSCSSSITTNRSPGIPPKGASFPFPLTLS